MLIIRENWKCRRVAYSYPTASAVAVWNTVTHKLLQQGVRIEVIFGGPDRHDGQEYVKHIDLVDEEWADEFLRLLKEAVEGVVETEKGSSREGAD